MVSPWFASPVQRSIDMHYQAQATARNTGDFVRMQGDFMRQADERAREVVSRLDKSNQLLATLVGGVDRLNVTAEGILSAVRQQTGILVAGFQAIAERLYQQQRLLEEIADILRRPYETQALELLQRAQRALKDGMGASGRDQLEWFKDGMRLLQDVLNNPVGKQNYVAWFQTGWLHWRFTKNIPAAEEAFYQAARLSAPQRDLYHANSLRHQAYMQYFQSRYTDAYSTIHKAMLVVPNDHDTMYDAARYAACTGRETEALEILDKCIELQPQTIVVMFAEEDFIK